MHTLPAESFCRQSPIIPLQASDVPYTHSLGEKVPSIARQRSEGCLFGGCGIHVLMEYVIGHPSLLPAVSVLVLYSTKLWGTD